MFDSMMFKINSLNKEEILKYAEKRANLSDICIGHYNERKDVEGFGAKEFYQMMGNSEKKKALSNALAFKVGAVYGLGDEAVKGLMRKIEGDEVLSLPERGENAITTKLKMKGFTVVELMIAVAVVGLVTTMAVPVYQTHVAKAQVSEGINLAGGIKAVIDEYHSNNGSFPKTGDVVGVVNTSGKYVGSTSIGDNGAIVATFGNDVIKGLDGKYVALTPSVEKSGNLSWECSSNAPKDYLPKSCDYVNVPVKSWLSNDYSNIFNKANSQYYRVPGVFWQYSTMYLPNGKDSTLTVTPGTIYKVDFVSPDGTLVFKTLGMSGQPKLLALKSNGSLMYQMPNDNTAYSVNKDGSYTAISQEPKWLSDYLASDDYKKA